jgi:uncharacterized protein (TIGR00251 family)
MPPRADGNPLERPSARVKLSATASGAVRLEIHAKPRARASRVVGSHGAALDVSLAAPPVDGAANAEAVRFLAELFGVPRARVTIVRGESARLKLVEVVGVSVEAAREAIDRAT